MKFRSGFVSNSSSCSSFNLFGLAIANEDLDIALCQDVIDAIGEDEVCAYEVCGWIDGHSDLCTSTGSNSDVVYIGLSFDSMEDHETKVEFYERIIDNIKKFVKQEFLDSHKYDIGHHSEEWYDG